MALNKLQLIFSVFICLLTLAACSSIGSTKTFLPQAGEADQAVIYFYRPTAVSNATYSPELYINGEPELAVKNGQNSRLVLPAGQTMIDIAPDKKYYGLTSLTVELTAGTIFYIRLDTAIKLDSSDSYEPYRRSFSLIQVDEKLAVREIAECCAVASSETPENVEASTDQIKSDNSFSVDKTQNPFSH